MSTLTKETTMNINNLKMIVKPKYNYGYKVGVTVHINGKKFPTEKSYVYAHNKNNKAVRSALIEGKYYNDDELVVAALRKEISNNA
jgi:hypothetical protein